MENVRQLHGYDTLTIIINVAIHYMIVGTCTHRADKVKHIVINYIKTNSLIFCHGSINIDHKLDVGVRCLTFAG